MKFQILPGHVHFTSREEILQMIHTGRLFQLWTPQVLCKIIYFYLLPLTVLPLTSYHVSFFTYVMRQTPSVKLSSACTCQRLAPAVEMSLLCFIASYYALKQFSKIVPIMLKKVPIMPVTKLPFLTNYEQCACTLRQLITRKI